VPRFIKKFISLSNSKTMSRIPLILLVAGLTLLNSVSHAQPDWSVTPSDYEYSMTMTTTAVFECIETADTNDVVVAFINGEVRGVQKLNTEFQGSNLAFMIIYDNAFNGSEITFKMYDASLDSIFEAQQEMTFEENSMAGNEDDPFLLTTECTTGLFDWTQSKTESLSVFPNPASSFVTIQADEKIDELRLYDLYGKLVLAENNVLSNVLDISSLTPQLYTVVGSAGGKIFTSKLLVNH